MPRERLYSNRVAFCKEDRARRSESSPRFSGFVWCQFLMEFSADKDPLSCLPISEQGWCLLWKQVETLLNNWHAKCACQTVCPEENVDSCNLRKLSDIYVNWSFLDLWRLGSKSSFIGSIPWHVPLVNQWHRISDKDVITKEATGRKVHAAAEKE